MCNICLFFFKQKTAYDMRISDWSSTCALPISLGEDFAPVIEERQLTAAWTQMLESLRQAAVLDPLVVVNGDPDGLYFPSHLAVQGFYLLRSRTQLREISAILLR